MKTRSKHSNENLTPLRESDKIILITYIYIKKGEILIMEYDLERFISAQEHGYKTALSEIMDKKIY